MQINSLVAVSDNPRSKISWPEGRKLFGIDAYLTLLFLIVNLYVFTFINGVFWDDWVIHHRGNDFYSQYFKLVGALELVGYVHQIIQGIGVWLYKVIVVILFYTLLVLFGRFLKEIGISELLKNILLVCLIIFPLFESRFLSIHLFYVISIVSFLFGLLLMMKDRVYLAQLFFIISYINNSYILVASVSILIYSLVFQNEKKINGFLLTALGALIFILIKYWFYVPNGSYEGYNKISLHLIGPAIARFFDQFSTLIKWLLFEQSPIRLVFFLVVGNLISYLCIARHLRICQVPYSICERKLFLLFLGISLAGLLPYFMVGKTPYFYYDYGSRHFSGAFIGLIGLVGYFVYFIAGAFLKAQKIIVTLLFGLMIAVNWLILDDYRIENKKSLAVINALESVDDLPNQFVLIHDDTGLPWASRRKGLSFYEWGGIFRRRLDGQSVNQDYFIYDSVFWSGEGCNKNSGLYLPEFSADISNRKNNLATLINIQQGSEPSIFLFNIDLVINIKKNIEVCGIKCGECGFSK